MNNRERESHAQGVYQTQYTLRMGTIRLKQEEETDTGIMQNSKKFGRKERGKKRKSQIRPN